MGLSHVDPWGKGIPSKRDCAASVKDLGQELS